MKASAHAAEKGLADTGNAGQGTPSPTSRRCGQKLGVPIQGTPRIQVKGHLNEAQIPR
jgi:hypothetical protein